MGGSRLVPRMGDLTGYESYPPPCPSPLVSSRPCGHPRGGVEVRGSNVWALNNPNLSPLHLFLLKSKDSELPFSPDTGVSSRPTVAPRDVGVLPRRSRLPPGVPVSGAPTGEPRAGAGGPSGRRARAEARRAEPVVSVQRGRPGWSGVGDGSGEEAKEEEAVEAGRQARGSAPTDRQTGGARPPSARPRPRPRALTPPPSGAGAARLPARASPAPCPRRARTKTGDPAGPRRRRRRRRPRPQLRPARGGAPAPAARRRRVRRAAGRSPLPGLAAPTPEAREAPALVLGGGGGGGRDSGRRARPRARPRASPRRETSPRPSLVILARSLPPP